jgi:hypothetical protein
MDEKLPIRNMTNNRRLKKMKEEVKMLKEGRKRIVSFPIEYAEC